MKIVLSLVAGLMLLGACTELRTAANQACLTYNQINEVAVSQGLSWEVVAAEYGYSPEQIQMFKENIGVGCYIASQ